MEKAVSGSVFNDTAVCIGNFDGVHRAHRELIERTVSQSDGLKSLVYTFLPHPAEVFGNRLLKITTEDEKDALIEKSGADILYKEHCDRLFLAKSPEEYAKEVLKEQLGAKKVFVGYDFTFGKSSSGSAGDLKLLGEKYGFSVTVLPRFNAESGEAVKSSAVREYIALGDFDSANEMLGRAHSYSGIVMQCKMLGRRIGFPTANIYPEKELVLPPFGVYATIAKIGDRCYPSVSNVGINPTVEEGNIPKIETNIMGFDENIYGRRIKIEFYGMIRKEKKFKNLASLKNQIESDKITAKKIIDKKLNIW